MDAGKQFTFSVRRKMVRHVSAARMNADQFEQLADSCCLLAFVLNQMEVAKGPSSGDLFDDETLAKARRRAVEGVLGACYTRVCLWAGCE